MGNQNNNNGYENPYNPWQNNEQHNDNENKKKTQTEVTKQIIDTTKLTKKFVIKTLQFWGIALVIAITTSILTGSYIKSQYIKYVSYSSDILYLFYLFLAILPVLYNYQKYYKKKTNISFLILTFIIPLIFGLYPLKMHEGYTNNEIISKGLFSTKVTKYSDIEKIEITIKDLDTIPDKTNLFMLESSISLFKDSNDYINNKNIFLMNPNEVKLLENKFNKADKVYILETQASPKEISEQEYNEKLNQIINHYNSNIESFYKSDSNNIFDRFENYIERKLFEQS